MNKTAEILELTKKLVSIPSVVTTNGENDVATFIFDELSKLDYFISNPSHLRKISLINDSFNRFNVVAIIKKPETFDTILGIGHFDTVDVEDYGLNKKMACNVDALSELVSSDNSYAYGRGVLDMKSGLAIWMQLLKDISNNDLTPTTNIVVGFVCDEENASAGMKGLVHELLTLKENHDFNYLGAIDSDYTSERYPNDEHRYVYFGSVGKLLVDIYAIGKETHAADPFLGVDANLLISAILQEIVGNPVYTEQDNGVSTPVPISLKIENPSRQYSVKTNKIAMTSINVITYKKSIEQWMELIKSGVSSAIKGVLEKRNNHFQSYCENNTIEYKALNTDFDVLFVNEVVEKSKEKFNEDVLEYLNNIDLDKVTIVIALSSPYYPAHQTTYQNQDFIDSVMSSLQKNYINHVMVLPYYPYISDLSFLMSPSLDTLAQVKKHSFDKTIIDDELWDVARELNVAMVNIGPYGYDAHKDMERLEIKSVGWVYDVIKDVLTD